MKCQSLHSLNASLFDIIVQFDSRKLFKNITIIILPPVIIVYSWGSNQPPPIAITIVDSVQEDLMANLILINVEATSVANELGNYSSLVGRVERLW